MIIMRQVMICVNCFSDLIILFWRCKLPLLTGARPGAGLELIQKAAERYGPTLHEIPMRRIEGRDLPKDTEKGSRGRATLQFAAE